MSREILEAVQGLGAREGHLPREADGALEDALLSAYKKQPGSARYARVEMDRDTGDFASIELIAARAPRGPAARRDDERGQAADTSTPRPARCVEPQEPEIDPAKLERVRATRSTSATSRRDDFGRIAAQTAKQVILQRIREAERDMMFEEYRDRVGELITGIVQQSDSRYTLVQLRERVEALLPKSEQVDGERYDHSQRIKAVIKEVSPSTQGPEHHRLAARPGAHQEAVRARGARDRRRPGRDHRRRPRARLPLEDRRRLARRRRRPGRRLRRPARLARAHGRLRAARREDRHHPLQRRARPLRGQGARRPRACARCSSTTTPKQATVDRARRPAVAGHRPRGPERPPRRPPDRLADRHPAPRPSSPPRSPSAATRRRRPAGRCAAILANGRRCPNAALPGLALLRPGRPPGARGHRQRRRRRPTVGDGLGGGRGGPPLGDGSRAEAAVAEERA